MEATTFQKTSHKYSKIKVLMGVVYAQAGTKTTDNDNDSSTTEKEKIDLLWL